MARHDSFAGNPAQAAIFAAKFAAHFCALHSRAAISIARHFPSNNASAVETGPDVKIKAIQSLARRPTLPVGSAMVLALNRALFDRSFLGAIINSQHLMHVELDPVGMPRADADEQVLHQPAVVRGTGLESRH
jgi:hypothetical protein